MSSDARFLAIRLEGPLQSWGFDSQYSRRNTGLFPTKSAIAGMCCAARGLPRGSDEERDFLAKFKAVRMIAIAIPRQGKKRELLVRRLQDYHTVQHTRRANGSIDDDCVLTYRQYLMDATFGIILKGDAVLLNSISAALSDPIWGIWLGRKTCIPSAPILAGLSDGQEEALSLLLGDRSIESFTRQEDVDNFIDGRDSLPDVAVTFALARRSFSPRRVTMTMAGIKRQ